MLLQICVSRRVKSYEILALIMYSTSVIPKLFITGNGICVYVILIDVVKGRGCFD